MNVAKLLLILLCFSLFHNTDPRVVGAMRKVMWEGNLQNNIYLDTISQKSHLFGLGPMENLAGEIMIVDGKSYQATVSGETVVVKETFDLKAPFFGYASIDRWKEIALPDNVRSLVELERFITGLNSASKPFMFRVKGQVDKATIHVVDLPAGTMIKSPEDVHRNQKKCSLANEQVEMVGFFSTRHQGIFTHHDSYLHLHLINARKTTMGHLEMAQWKSGAVKLLLPE